MFLFAAPIYFVFYIIYLIYTGLIKKTLSNTCQSFILEVYLP